jgi:hypothetical protein
MYSCVISDNITVLIPRYSIFGFRFGPLVPVTVAVFLLSDQTYQARITFGPDNVTVQDVDTDIKILYAKLLHTHKLIEETRQKKIFRQTHKIHTPNIRVNPNDLIEDYIIEPNIVNNNPKTEYSKYFGDTTKIYNRKTIR